MTLLQGDRCCSRLLSWGLKKTGKEHSPRDFHSPTVHRAAPAAVGCHGAERSKAETTSLPSHPWECLQQPLVGGDSTEPVSPRKALGTQFSSPVPPIDGKTENWERQLGK